MSAARPVVVALMLVACGPRGSMPPPPPSPAALAGPQVLLPDGAALMVELSADDETRAMGLMFRESLAPDRGMLFLFPETGIHPFWMKNTLIALDLIWIDDSYRIVHIERDVPPCRADPCPSYVPSAPSRFALELAAGQATAHGLKLGDAVVFRNVNASASG